MPGKTVQTTRESIDGVSTPKPRRQPGKTVGADGHGVFVQGKGRFDPLLLRDRCTCPLCVDTSSGQKLFSTVDIPANITAREIEKTKNGIFIHWTNDIPSYTSDHVTYLPRSHLGDTEPVKLPDKTEWNGESIQTTNLFVDYEEYMTQEDSLYSALSQLWTYGIVFIQNVPESEQSVVAMANRIGPLKNTFYGQTWDVRSVPDAKNVAYTSQDLGFHMDLLYMESPPRLQLLHCLRASTSGGSSLFTDSYRALRELARTKSFDYDTLQRKEVLFHYNNDGHHLYRKRPVIGPLLPPFGRQVSWSPPFQGPFSGPSVDIHDNITVRQWYKAAKSFDVIVEKKDAIYERQMAPGECVIFDNRRVLHARTSFKVDDVGKERWLKGAYLDTDPFLSKLSVLQASRAQWRDSKLKRVKVVSEPIWRKSPSG